MLAIYLKITFTLVLSIIPFVYMIRMRNMEYNNAFLQLIGKSDNIRNLCNGIRKFCYLLHEGMKKSDSFRQFFILIIFIITLIFQVTDSIASRYIINLILDASQKNAPLLIEKYGALASSDLATIITFIFSLVLLKYEWANRLLLFIKNNRRITMAYMVVILTLILMSYFSIKNNIILAEIMTIILYAGFLYPKKENETFNKKSKMS